MRRGRQIFPHYAFHQLLVVDHPTHRPRSGERLKMLRPWNSGKCKPEQRIKARTCFKIRRCPAHRIKLYHQRSSPQEALGRKEQNKNLVEDSNIHTFQPRASKN